MDIPEAARQAKKAEIERDYPQMSKFPDVAEQFLNAQLEDEWGRDPAFPGGIEVEGQQGQLAFHFLRARGGNAISVPVTMPEAYAFHARLGEALGL